MDTSVVHEAERIQLGSHTFTIVEGQIYDADDKPVPLRAKSLQVLRELLELRGQIVSKQHLAATVWPQSIATDETISRCVADIRKFLGPEAKEILQTFPKKGYCIPAADSGQLQKPDKQKRGDAEYSSPDESGAVAQTATQPELVAADKTKRATRTSYWTWGAVGIVLAVLAFLSLQPKLTTSPAQNSRPLLALQPIGFAADTVIDEDLNGLKQSFSEDLHRQLAQISGLSVVPEARTSRLDWSAMKVSDLVTTTGASHLLRGELILADDVIQVKADLVEVSSNRTVWSGDISGPEENLLTYRNQLLDDVLKELDVTLSVADFQRLETLKNVNPVAYNYTLEGRRYVNQFNYEASLAAERSFRKAISVDPTYARAYTEAAAALAIRLENDWSVLPKIDEERGILLAQKAIEFDPDSWSAHYALGRVYTMGPSRDFDAGEKHLKIAMSLQPDNDDARAFFVGIKNFKNEPEIAIPLIESAIASHPAPPFWYYLGYGNALYLAGRFEEAEEILDTCLAQQPAAPYCLRYQIVNYASLGSIEDASWALAEYQMLGYETSIQALMDTMYNRDADVRKAMRNAFIAAGASE